MLCLILFTKSTILVFFFLRINSFFHSVSAAVAFVALESCNKFAGTAGENMCQHSSHEGVQSDVMATWGAVGKEEIVEGYFTLLAKSKMECTCSRKWECRMQDAGCRMQAAECRRRLGDSDELLPSRYATWAGIVVYRQRNTELILAKSILAIYICTKDAPPATHTYAIASQLIMLLDHNWCATKIGLVKSIFYDL